MSRAGLPLPMQCRLAGLPEPRAEFRFHPVRAWRFDFAWESMRLACEIEGGVFKAGGSRHSRGAGYEGDCEKYAEALVLGWRVLRVTTGMANDGRALGYLERILKGGC